MRNQVAWVVLALWLGGCGEETTPTGPTGGQLEVGEPVLVENSAVWATNAVSWINRNAADRVPEDAFAVTAVSTQSMGALTTHFLLEAAIVPVCDGDCFKRRGDARSLAEVTIGSLAWSPTAAEVVVEANFRAVGEPRGPHVAFWPAAGGPFRARFPGQMPAYNREGTAVVFVSPNARAVMRVGIQGIGQVILAEDLAIAEDPSLSAGDSLLAWSQVTPTGRRIMVLDLDLAGAVPVAASDPDEGRDGRDDRYPQWSPRSNFLAYVAGIDRGAVSPALFVARVGDRSAIDGVQKIHEFRSDQRIQHLAWHPDGRLMLLVIDGNVYVMLMPEHVRDAPLG